MNGTATRFVRFGLSLGGMVILGWVLTGYAAKPVRNRISLPTDWSHHHLIFSNPASAEQWARVNEEPRYWQQVYRRQQRLALPEQGADFGRFWPERVRNIGKNVTLKRDWSEDLGSGASPGAGNYPAKYSFDITTANCASATTPDYVVYSTGLLGTPGPSGQASIVAFDNLYSGCTGAPVPSLYWAYNTAAQVLTSPVISRGGSQVAFVQTVGGEAGLVILKWAAGTGTITNPVAPTSYSASSYHSGCTAPCMTEVFLHDNASNPLDDTTSSVFYDYKNDVAWVGGALGWLHKITGVFNGVPTEVTTGGFPVQVYATTWLSSPVYDAGSGNVFVGDSSGYLYRVNAGTAAVTQSGQLDQGAGVVDGPLVDSASGFVYAFASSDGSFDCGSGAVACSAVYQLSTTFAAGDMGNEVEVGSSVKVATLPNPNPLYIGAFDSSYYNTAGASGNLYVCGDTGLNPILYQVPITAGAFPLSGSGTPITTLTSTSTSIPCSPVTDIPNPNTTGGASERLFASVSNNGIASTCTAGCVFNFVTAPWQASTTYAVGQEILTYTFTKFYTQVVVTATGPSGPTAPIFTNIPGSTTTDGGVTWLNQGVASATIPPWVAGKNYRTADRIVDSNGNLEVSTMGGHAGSSAPDWNMTIGGTTTDGAVTWMDVGAPPTFGLAAVGGTSGIIADNTVAPGTLAGASQVYFSTLGNQTCTTSTGTGGCAVQASQPALQ